MATYRQARHARLGMLVVLGTIGCARATRVESSAIPGDIPSLQESLRDVFMAQEIYYSHPDNKYTYANDAARLQQQYRGRQGITLTIFEGTTQGWSGMVQGASGNACVMYVGKVSKVPVTPRGTAAAKPAVGNNLEMMCDAPSKH